MCNEEPKANPAGIYNVKDTCNLLEVHRRSLGRWRRQGRIKPLNPALPRLFTYTGAEIIRFWHDYNYQKKVSHD